MKNFLTLFIIILIFSCQNEKLYKERKAQKEQDILNGNSLTDCKCTDSEFELEQDFLLYLIDKKGFDRGEALTYANCGYKLMTEWGNENLSRANEIIEQNISIQYNKYGFNPYDDKISEEEKQTLANDSTFDPIFPYQIKDFGFYSTLISNQFTYEMFIGLQNNLAYISADPLTDDEIDEYVYVMSEMVRTKFLVEGEHYIMICPSRIKEENQSLLGVDEEVFKPCKEDFDIDYFIADQGLSDSDSDGLPDTEEVSFETDPNNPDTDADGITDTYEIYVWSTDPLDFESSPSEDEIYYFENCEEK